MLLQIFMPLTPKLAAEAPTSILSFKKLTRSAGLELLTKRRERLSMVVPRVVLIMSTIKSGEA
jgi:hypothetical protein